MAEEVAVRDAVLFLELNELDAKRDIFKGGLFVNLAEDLLAGQEEDAVGIGESFCHDLFGEPRKELEGADGT